MTMNFADFGLPEKLMQSLNRMQFSTPTPIQEQAIPVALEGRDILGSAQTGTGKTGAFGIPLVAKLMEDENAQALVMTPTRELASQVMAALQQMIPVPNIKTALLIGGEAMPRQFRQLQQKPRLIVGTPGRINDHLNRGSLKLNKARFLVLDETDRMLDMGFGIQIDTILQHVPEQRQTMLFSATLPAGIVKLSSKYLKDPQRIAVGSTHAPAAKIKQELVQTSESEKYEKLLVQLNQRTGSVIIFVKTKYGADRLATRLTKAEHGAEAIHGDLKQSRRERVIQDFRNRKHRILVATDVAARGLDIPHIEHVVNYDLPQCPEDYIHRIGRTARAGAEGEAVNLLTPADNAKWRAIVRLMNPEEKLPAHKDGGERSEQRRKPSGPRKFGNKSWDKKPSFSRRDDQPRQDRQERGEHKSWNADKPRQDNAERKVWNDKPRHEGGERKVWNDKPRQDGERKSWGDKPRHEGGERKSWSDKPRRDDKPFGERKVWSDKPRQKDGERKSWGDKPRQDGKAFGERKVWNDKPRQDGERKSWGDKPRANDGGNSAAAPKKKHYGDRMKKRASADGKQGGFKPRSKPRAA